MPKISAAGGPSVAGEGLDRIQAAVEQAAEEQGLVLGEDGVFSDPATGQRFELSITATAEVEHADEQRRADERSTDESELAELPDNERSADERADDGFVLDTGDEINDPNEPKE